MEAVRDKVISILNLDPSTLDNLMQKFSDLGVTHVDDLVDIQFSDISPDILLPIPARKLIRMCAEPASESPAVAVSRASLSSPGPSRNPETMPLTPSSSQNASVSSNWHVSYDPSSTIAAMMSSSTTPLSAKQAARYFVDGSVMSAAQRNEVVRYVVDDMLKLCSNPSRANINTIAEKIVSKCPKLKDEIDGSVIGCGYTSVRNQLENRVSYVKRPMSAQRKACGMKRRLGDDTENSSVKKSVRDGYGCADFLPATFPEEETEQSLVDKQQQLKEMHVRGLWTDSEVSSLMSLTYVMQRQDLVGVSPQSVGHIVAEWPFLCQPKWIVQHLNRLLGFDIVQQLDDGIMKKKESLYSFFSLKSTSVKRLGRSLAASELDTRPSIALIPLLMAYFGEREEVILLPKEVSEEK